jgi:hypothetical protein
MQIFFRQSSFTSVFNAKALTSYRIDDDVLNCVICIQCPSPVNQAEMYFKSLSLVRCLKMFNILKTVLKVKKKKISLTVRKLKYSYRVFRNLFNFDLVSGTFSKTNVSQQQPRPCHSVREPEPPGAA